MFPASVPGDYFSRGEKTANRQPRPVTTWKMVAHHVNGQFSIPVTPLVSRGGDDEEPPEPDRSVEW